MSKVFISICIPAYKRTDFLKRLLDSIAEQYFKDFEVIISDDSPLGEVKMLCDQYRDKFKLLYQENNPSLGTPENWNEAIRKASGEWIKLMHDDDWFSRADSLDLFAKAAQQHPGTFIFSSYTNVFFSDNRHELVTPESFRMEKLRKNPVTLMSKNIIGPPSVIMHKNDGKFFYDKNIKWLVDIDFYIRRLSQEKIFHIKEALVFVGLGEEQVTMLCHSRPEVEIPENNYFLKKTGIKQLKNILVYDAWWRLFRNLSIKSEQDLQKYTTEKWPDVVLSVLKDVNKLSPRLVRVGVLSKLFMTLSYIKNRRKIR